MVAKVDWCPNWLVCYHKWEAPLFCLAMSRGQMQDNGLSWDGNNRAQKDGLRRRLSLNLWVAAFFVKIKPEQKLGVLHVIVELLHEHAATATIDPSGKSNVWQKIGLVPYTKPELPLSSLSESINDYANHLKLVFRRYSENQL